MDVKLIEVQHDDPVLHRIIDSCPDNGSILMGGAARSLYSGEPIKDYDFAFCSPEKRSVFIKHLRSIGAEKVAENRSGPNRILACEDFIYQYGSEEKEYAYIQCKCEFYKNPTYVFNTADFTVVQFCFMEGSLFATEQGISDYEGRLMRLFRVSAPESTLIRMERFLSKGYKPANGSAFYAELVRRIRELPESHVGKPTLKLVKKP